MSQQTTLNFDAADRAEIDSTRPLSVAEQFDEFHRDNPDVYSAIRDRALRLHAEGYKRWSIEEIWNWLRWHRQCRTTGKPFTLNNNYKKPYVDKLVSEFPQLDSMFVRKGGNDGKRSRKTGSTGSD